jgi:putative hydrolase
MGPGSNPFGFDFTQLMRMFQSQGPVNLDVARQVATVIATTDPDTGTTHGESPVGRDVEATFAELVQAAQHAVAEATGISETFSMPMRTTTREQWAHTTLDGLEPVLRALAGALTGPTRPATHPSAADPDAFFGMIMQTLLPVLLGVWSGSMIGQLAHDALGQHDLPLPLDGPPTLLFVARNVDEFAHEWEVPVDELRYALAVRETVRGAQRCVPWVRERVVELASRYVAAYELRPDAFEEHLGGLDFTDPSTMQSLGDPSALGGLADPTALLAAMQSPRQEPLLEELQRFVAVLEGYADVIVDSFGEGMIPSHPRIDEALRRRRVERGDAAAFIDRLLGMQLAREHYDAGVGFCRGVVERAGMAGLGRLWERPEMAPTRAEVEAPGLWLARIELPD